MKKRNGFVTNSSSTSYVCEISGHKEVFRDSEDHRNYGFYRCDNDHVFLEEFVLDVKEECPSADIIKEKLREYFPHRIKYSERYEKSRYEKLLSELDSFDDNKLQALYEEYVDCWLEGDIREYQCPICQMEVLSQNDLVRYLTKKYGVTQEEAFEDVKKSNKRRQKLYEGEYINYVYKKLGFTEDVVFVQIKADFADYKKFKEYLRS